MLASGSTAAGGRVSAVSVQVSTYEARCWSPLLAVLEILNM